MSATSLAIRYDAIHYPESGNELSKRLNIHTLDWYRIYADDDEKPCKSQMYEWIWIKKGQGIVWLDERKSELKANSIYCICPGQYRKVWLNEEAEGYYMSVAPEFISLSDGYRYSAFFAKQNWNIRTLTSVAPCHSLQYELEVVISKIKWELQNQFEKKVELLKGLLNVFLIYFTRNLNEQEEVNNNTREAELVSGFLELVKKHFIQKKLVSNYASELFVTPNYLNRTVKKLTGYTASHHIQQQIITEAKRKAVYTSTSMKKIAYDLGFDNLAHFSKFFKNNCGMSFTDFKKGMLMGRGCNIPAD